jgi:hypothetical protein
MRRAAVVRPPRSGGGTANDARAQSSCLATVVTGKYRILARVEIAAMPRLYRREPQKAKAIKTLRDGAAAPNFHAKSGDRIPA